MLFAAAIVVALAFPSVAQAATIYVNKGVSGATLGMKDTTAIKKLGKVKKKYKDPDYGGTYWTYCFGTKRNGHYSLEMTSNDDHKVIAFVVYASKYVTKKKIHTGSTVKALKKAYGKSLVKRSGYYRLKSSTGQTWFWVSGTKDSSKVTKIWIWK